MQYLIHRRGWTFFPHARSVGARWEGAVSVFIGTEARFAVHVCGPQHAGEAAALEDALHDAQVLADTLGRLLRTKDTQPSSALPE